MGLMMGNRGAVALALVSLLAASTAVAAPDRDVDAPPPSNPWRPVFFGALGATVVVTAVSAVSYVKFQSEVDQIDATKPDLGLITHEDCNLAGTVIEDNGGHFRSACTWRSRYKTAAYFGAGLTLVTLATAYLAFAGGGDGDGDDRVAVTPTVSPDGAGASLSLRW